MSKETREQRKFYMNDIEWSKTLRASAIEGEAPSEYVRIATKKRNEVVLKDAN